MSPKRLLNRVDNAVLLRFWMIVSVVVRGMLKFLTTQNPSQKVKVRVGRWQGQIFVLVETPTQLVYFGFMGFHRV